MDDLPNASENRPATARKNFLTIIILLGLMFSCLDTSIVSTALVNISADLGHDELDAPWAILAYLLSYMSLAVGFSKASDVFGRRNMCVVAWIFFSGFSIGCALSQTMTQLIAFRALQGIGGSGLYSLAQVCLVELGPGGPEVIGALVGITLSISYLLGPILGGLFSSYWTWRGVFWINVPFGVLSIAGLVLIWDRPESLRLSRREIVAKIDIVGITLLLAGSLLLVFGLEQGGALVWEWSNPILLWTLCTSCISWVSLIIWQGMIYSARNPFTEPILPMRLVAGRIYCAAVLVTFLTGFIYVSLVILIPEQLQILYNDTPIMAGVHLLAMLGACAFGSFITGFICKKKNYTSQVLMAGSVLQMCGMGALYIHTWKDTSIKEVFGYTAVYGLGVGLCFAAATIMTSVEARHDDLAVAQGVISQARVLGGAIGLAVCTIIFNLQVQRDLAGYVDVTPEQLDEIHRSPLSMLRVHDPAVQAQLEVSYLKAFRAQMLVMVLVSVGASAASMLTYQREPPAVMDRIAQHKEFPARGSITELESLGSVRSRRREAEEGNPQ